MSDILRFPVDNYTMDVSEAMTKNGPVKVDYRKYEHLRYVANPVDADYQSLDVWVPVAINGQPYDASNAPIFFVIAVGGYMSSRNRGGDGFPGGFPGGPGGPPGGPGGFPGGPGGPPGGANKANGGGYLGLGGDAGVGDNKALALAYGFVVVQPGCRGRDNEWPEGDPRGANGKYYGKAPAGMVDLKAAVRYLRHNKGVMPGDPEKIFSTGGSGGAALSVLLAASGNSDLYAPYLEAIGAADERDDICGTASYSAITDLEHADASYEWEYGKIPASGNEGGPMGFVPAGMVDQELSGQLADLYLKYQDELALEGIDGYGPVTSANAADYILKKFLIPAANKAFFESTKEQQDKYLAEHPWFTFDGESACFTWEAFVEHCGRLKGLPAFDDFNKAMAEPTLFGTATENSRHFTEFSLRNDPNETATELSDDLKVIINMMNPMYYIRSNNPGCAPNWWIRHGACDKDTSLPIITNMATAVSNIGKNVSARLIWDGGHCADDDTEGFMIWIKGICD